MVVNQESAYRGYTVFDRTTVVSATNLIFRKLCKETPREPEQLFTFPSGPVDFEDETSSPTIDADKLAWYCDNTKTITMMTRCAGGFARLVELKRGCPRSGKNKRQTWAAVIRNKLHKEVKERKEGLRSSDQRTIDAILLHATGSMNPPDKVCDNCKRGTGPFEGCVIDSDPSGAYMSGCSNCRYQNHGPACLRKVGRGKGRRGEEEKKDEGQEGGVEEETGEEYEEEGVKDKGKVKSEVNENEDDSMSTLKSDSARKRISSNIHPTTIPHSPLPLQPHHPNTHDTNLSLRPRRTLSPSQKPPTPPPRPPNPPSSGSGKSGQVHAAASIAALESMSPASRKVYADVMVGELGRRGLIEKGEKRGGDKGGKGVGRGGGGEDGEGVFRLVGGNGDID